MAYIARLTADVHNERVATPRVVCNDPGSAHDFRHVGTVNSIQCQPEEHLHTKVQQQFSVSLNDTLGEREIEAGWLSVATVLAAIAQKEMIKQGWTFQDLAEKDDIRLKNLDTHTWPSSGFTREDMSDPMSQVAHAMAVDYSAVVYWEKANGTIQKTI